MPADTRRVVCAALAVLLTASPLCGCAETASTTSVSSRDLGTPSTDQLQDLNKWTGDVALLSGDVSFESGDHVLTKQGAAILSGLAEHLRNSEGAIRVDGFADGVGGDGPANDQLSEARAVAVQKWLIEEGGVPAERFGIAIGHGTRDDVGGVVAREGIADPLRRVVRITVG